MGIDIKNISTDGSTIKNYQKAWRGQIHTSLKSDAAKREIDVHSTVAAMLKKFIGERKQGLLFCSRKQLWQANIFQLRPHGLIVVAILYRETYATDRSHCASKSLEWGHTDGPARGGRPGPDVSMSFGSRPSADQKQTKGSQRG